MLPTLPPADLGISFTAARLWPGVLEVCAAGGGVRVSHNMGAWGDLLDAPRDEQVEALAGLIEYAFETSERWKLFSDEAVQSMVDQEADREELAARRIADGLNPNIDEPTGDETDTANVEPPQKMMHRDDVVAYLITSTDLSKAQLDRLSDTDLSHVASLAIEKAERDRTPIGEVERPLYGDVAALLDGTTPEPPKPSILTRSDGVAVFYRSEINGIEGDPESGKTWVSFSAIVEELNAGGRCAFIDIDNNGMNSVVYKLIRLGADPAKLRDSLHFRYVQPEDAQHLNEVVADCEPWAPTLAVYDCVSELMSLYGGSNNSDDDYTRTIRGVVKPLVRTGAAVILIDHLAKGQESRNYGAGGTMAKLRSISGISVRVIPAEKLTPGRGGRLQLIGRKDRHGAVRRHCPPIAKGGFDVGDFIVTEDAETGTMRAVVHPLEDRQPALAPGACGPIRDDDRDYLGAAENLTAAKGDTGFTVSELARTHYHTVDPSRAQTEETRRVVNRLQSAGHLACVHEGGSRTAAGAKRYVVVMDDGDE